MTKVPYVSQEQRLCDLGIAVSRAEARRLLYVMPTKRLQQLIAKKEKLTRAKGDSNAQK